jgi:hypothetical protein
MAGNPRKLPPASYFAERYSGSNQGSRIPACFLWFLSQSLLCETILQYVHVDPMTCSGHLQVTKRLRFNEATWVFLFSSHLPLAPVQTGQLQEWDSVCSSAASPIYLAASGSSDMGKG